MEIQMRRAMTFDDSFDDLCRRAAPQPTDAKTLLSILEEEAGDKPLVLIIAGVRPGEKPGRWDLREVRKLLAYRSKVFLKIEKTRLEEEKRAVVQAARTARLDQIKAELRTELKTESVEREKAGEDFDRKYDEQKEREIEERATTILEAEEEN